MATKFGKELRKIRIEHDDNLNGMARKLGVSASYISGVEAGNRAIPSNWIQKLSDSYSLNQTELASLESAYIECMQFVKLDMHAASVRQRSLTTMFFRRLPTLSDQECEELIHQLSKTNVDDSDC